MAYVCIDKDGVTVGPVVTALPETGHLDYIASFVEITDDIAQWPIPWRLSDGVWSPVGKIAALAAELGRCNAARRWAAQQLGAIAVLADGRKIAVDTVGLGFDALSSKAVYGAVNPNAMVPWKFKSGEIVPLKGSDIVAMFSAAEAHRDACFAREAVVKAAIDAAASSADVDPLHLIDTFNREIDAGWPQPPALEA